MGLEVAMLAFSAISAVKGFVDQRKAAKEEKKANNAARDQAALNADMSREEGAEQARQERKEAKRVRSQQIASFLQSGVTLDGSPMLVADETQNVGEQNSATTIKNAEARAKGFLLEGEASQKPVQKADIFGTAASVLGAAKGAKDAGAFKSKKSSVPIPKRKPARS